MRRGIVLGVPGLAIATGAGLWVETHRVATAPLPSFDDLDPSGTYGDPNGAPLAMTVLGDSTVTAPGLRSGAESWIAQLAAGLPRCTTLRSLAKGGSRVHDVLDDQLGPALTGGADLFVVAVGANDALHGTSSRRFRADLRTLLTELGHQAPVVSLGIGDLSVIPRIPVTLRGLLRWRCGLLDRVHAQVTADLDRAVRVPVAEVADPSFAVARDELFTADRFHPNHLGHTLWAASFVPFVRETIARFGGEAAGGGPRGRHPPHRATALHDGHSTPAIHRP
ncbi:MAG: GDSL-type esterase/lipase family protein [Microthrixaceae bacterium]|nr:GDSL-type esterase/lipase family protein [Microthrixaceae bacterium]